MKLFKKVLLADCCSSVSLCCKLYYFAQTSELFVTISATAFYLRPPVCVITAEALRYNSRYVIVGLDSPIVLRGNMHCDVVCCETVPNSRSVADPTVDCEVLLRISSTSVAACTDTLYDYSPSFKQSIQYTLTI